jgi:hypothetical protein
VVENDEGDGKSAYGLYVGAKLCAVVHGVESI